MPKLMQDKLERTFEFAMNGKVNKVELHSVYMPLFEKFLHLRIMRAQEGVLYHDIALYVLAIYEIIVSRHKLQGKEEKEGKL